MSVSHSQVANSNGSSTRVKTSEGKPASATRAVKPRSVTEVARNMLRLSAETLYEFAREKLKR
jgi:hypothetical protein